MATCARVVHHIQLKLIVQLIVTVLLEYKLPAHQEHTAKLLV